jgi:hypothetical protein
MTERDAAAVALEGLFRFFGHKPESSVLKVYVRALRGYPAAFVVAAVERAKESRTFLPRPNELVADAAACRREALNATPPFTPCAACDRTPGWISVADEQGVPRLQRCTCWREYCARLAPVHAPAAPLP